MLHLQGSLSKCKRAVKQQYESSAVVAWQSNHIGHGHPWQSALKKKKKKPK